MTLSELIAALAAADPTLVVPAGFTNPHSYRGYYADLAFEPAPNVTVGQMLADARSALGTTYQGWKGGDNTMQEYTDCWLSEEGTASWETIGPLLITLMIASGTVPEVSEPVDEVDRLRAALATVAEIADVLGDALPGDSWHAAHAIHQLAKGEITPEQALADAWPDED